MSLFHGYTQQYYDRDCIWHENYWTDVQLDRAKRTVSLLPSGPWSVVDVGCGAGVVTLELARRFPIVVGLDFALKPLRQLVNHNRKVRAIQGDVRALPIKNKSFDIVVAAEVIEHLSEQERILALQEMSRVARHYILITVPYRETLEAGQVKCAECGCIFHAHRHTKSFSEGDMYTLLDPEFRLVRIDHFGPRVKKIPKVLIMLAHIFGGYARVAQGTAICPQCGNSDRYTNRRNLMTRLFLGVPYRLLPLPKHPFWMAALYQRSSDLSCG